MDNPNVSPWTGFDGVLWNFESCGVSKPVSRELYFGDGLVDWLALFLGEQPPDALRVRMNSIRAVQ